MSKKNNVTPPPFPGEEAFKEAENKFQEWMNTDEGKHYAELSRKQQEDLQETGDKDGNKKHQ